MKATAEVAITADRPTAAAIVWTNVPALIPNDAVMPARRPPLRLRAITIAWFGPGAKTNATTASVYGSNREESIISQHNRVVGPQTLVARG